MKNLVLDFDGVIGDTFEVLVEAVARFTGVKKDFARKIVLNAGMKNRSYNFLTNFLGRIYFSRVLKMIQGREDLLFQKRIDEIGDIPNQKAILTRSDSRVCKYILGQNQDTFSIILGRNEASTKILGIQKLVEKYGFEKEKIVFVTDTVGDILELSKILELKQIYAVSWGFHSRDLLEKYLPSSQVIDSFYELNLS